ncbi:hypothetical protein K461DRAFT_307236 [Myriangium duriaei CBS 260.36]|uniref:BTB domain-containing protein n=1 Tax=Myriangium duriaei CBS 260.36 TaxID=1168546 RepID=A0A9P4J1U1_9PEZI|nr:hypothetical protein K461DRAFT_307236 [Myriangium duriaei CBS 260.36]
MLVLLEFVLIFCPQSDLLQSHHGSIVSRQQHLQQQAPPASRYSYSSNNEGLTTVLVGDKENKFLVHTDLICRNSPFFQATIKGAGNWIKKQQNDIRLPEDDPETFDGFLKRLCTSKISIPWDGKENDVDIHPLVKLYIFADKILAPRCKNATIAKLWYHFDIIKTISPQSLTAASTCLDRKDRLRIFLDIRSSNDAWKVVSLDLARRDPQVFHELVITVFGFWVDSRRGK